MIKAGAQLVVNPAIVTNDYTRRFYEAGFDGIVQTEITDNPGKQRFLIRPLARWRKRGGREIKAAENFPRLVNAVKTAHPDGRFGCLILEIPLYLQFRVHTPGVVRLVVDYKDVVGVGHVAERFPNVGFIAFCPSLVNAFLFGQFFLSVPLQGVPVKNMYFALS